MYSMYILKLVYAMANVNYIIELFSFCTKHSTNVMENGNLNTEMHCHFTYCILQFHFAYYISN